MKVLSDLEINEIYGGYCECVCTAGSFLGLQQYKSWCAAECAKISQKVRRCYY